MFCLFVCLFLRSIVVVDYELIDVRKFFFCFDEFNKKVIYIIFIIYFKEYEVFLNMLVEVSIFKNFLFM